MKDLEKFPQVKAFYELILNRYGEDAPSLDVLIAKNLGIENPDPVKLEAAKQSTDGLDPFSETLTDAEKKEIYERCILDPYYFLGRCMKPVPQTDSVDRTLMVYHLHDTLRRMQLVDPEQWDDTMTGAQVMSTVEQISRFCYEKFSHPDYEHLFVVMSGLLRAAMGILASEGIKGTLANLKQGRFPEIPSKSL